MTNDRRIVGQRVNAHAIDALASTFSCVSWRCEVSS